MTNCAQACKDKCMKCNSSTHNCTDIKMVGLQKFACMAAALLGTLLLFSQEDTPL